MAPRTFGDRGPRTGSGPRTGGTDRPTGGSRPSYDRGESRGSGARGGRDDSRGSAPSRDGGASGYSAGVRSTAPRAGSGTDRPAWQDRGRDGDRRGGAAPLGAGFRGAGGARGDDRRAPSRSAGPDRGDGARRDEGRPGDDDRRTTRPPQSTRDNAPEIPEDVVFGDLDRTVRARLRTLSKENAENVGRHLVMAGRLLDTDPELSYEHAQAAVRRGGRVDVVRESAGLAAYRTGRYAEALRELRTVRRLNGSSEHLAVMADCERGLGRPERAIALATSPEAEGLEADVRIELAIVVSGARLDLGEADSAVAVLSSAEVRAAQGSAAVRVAQARAAALEAAGRPEEAAAALAGYSAAELADASGDVDEDEDVVAFDLAESEDDDEGADEDEAGSADVAGAESDDAEVPELDESDDDEPDDESDDDQPDDEQDDDEQASTATEGR